MLALWITVTGAVASGLDAPQVGTLFSGATTADPAAVHFNPAALAGLGSPGLLLDLGLVAGRVGYRRERLGTYQHPDGLDFAAPVAPSDLDPSRRGRAEPVTARPLAPWAGLFAAGPVWRDRLFLGGGVSVPYAAPLRFPDDGPQRFQLTHAFLAVAQASLALAARPHPRVHLGVGASYVVGTASLARRQDFGALDLLHDAFADPPIGQPNDFGADAPTTVRELRVLERPFVFRDGLAHGGTFRVGLTARPVDRLTLAASYEHAVRLSFGGGFQLDLDDPLFQDDLAAKGLSYPERVEGDATLAFTLPSRIRTGLGVDVSSRVHLDLLAEGVLWSSLRAFELTLTSPDLAQPELGLPDTATASLPRRWRDALHVEVRAVVQADDRARVAVRAGWHSPASPEATIDVASPDGQRLVGGVGVGVLARAGVEVFLDAQVQAILPRAVTTSDFDLGNGRYDLVIGTVGVHVLSDLRPAGRRP